jgi:hypothetical protein
MKKENDIAVLLTIFNRPDTTEKVFQAIRLAKPKKLYISADAPRLNNKSDELECEKARAIVKKVDWDCTVKYRFLETNLGCGRGISSAISWAFDNEEWLIILEDDCVPSLPFFEYCNYCLKKYAHDQRVWIVSGRSHHENSKYFDDQDYIFSHHEHIWGWATWKRCWKHFDYDMKEWDYFYKNGGFLNSFLSKEEGIYYNDMFANKLTSKNIQAHAWSNQYLFAIQINSGLTITPSKNLIHNIGAIGVHSTGQLECHTLLASEDYKIEKEPKFVLANREYDLMHFKTHINPKKSFILRAINKVLRLMQIK